MKINIKQKFLVGLAIVAALLSSYLLLLTPTYLGKAVDLMVGLNAVDLVGVRKILMITLGFYLLYFVMSWLVSYIANYIAINIVSNYRTQLEYRLNRYPLAYLDTTPHGRLMNLFSMDSELLIDGIYQLLSQLLLGVFTVIFALYFMFTTNFWMSVLAIMMVPLMYLTSSIIAKRSLKLFKHQQALSADLSAHVSEAMNNHELITLANYQNQSSLDFEEIHEKYNEVGLKTQILGALVNPTIRVINNLSYALIGLVGAYFALNNQLTVGALTAFISYSIIFSKPFNEFSAIISQVMNARASFERIKMALAVEIEEDLGEEVILDGSLVQFDQVDFGYSKDNLIIKNLSLNIPPLSKVAIVGPTGAGKSTLINILMRFYDVDSGAIFVDNYNTSTISKDSLRSVMSIVLQDPWLFEGSIADNIKYGNVEASDEAMIEASKAAGCYEYIMSLDNQFETYIDLNSSSMSLGQKQMITIARAIIKDSPIIILDEATSNVDIVTESRIQKVFQNIMSNKTSFFVAHRLSTVVDSDIILVMRDGVLVEAGKHDELLSDKKFYYELYSSQMNG